MWKPVGAAVAVSFVTGGIWYNYSVFGKPWLKRAFPQKKIEDLEPKTSTYVAVTVSSVLSNSLLYYLLRQLQVTSRKEAICTGLLTSVLSGCLTLPHYLFAERPLVLFAIDCGYDTAVLITNALIMSYVGNLQ